MSDVIIARPMNVIVVRVRLICETHLYFENFTNDEINHIKNENDDFYICKSCLGWKTKDKCFHCINKRNSENIAKKRKKKI